MLLGLRQAVFFHFLVSRPFISTVVWSLALLPKMPKVLGSNLAEGLSVWSLHASSCDPKTRVRLISDTKIAHELFLCVGLTDDLSREASCPTTAGMGPSSAQNWMKTSANDNKWCSWQIHRSNYLKFISVHRCAACPVLYSSLNSFPRAHKLPRCCAQFLDDCSGQFSSPAYLCVIHLFLSPWSCSLPHCQCWWAFIPAKNWSWKLSITL